MHVNDFDMEGNIMPKAPRVLLFGDLLQASYHIPATLKDMGSKVFSFKAGTIWPQIHRDWWIARIEEWEGVRTLFLHWVTNGLVWMNKAKSMSNLDWKTVAKTIFNTCNVIERNFPNTFYLTGLGSSLQLSMMFSKPRGCDTFPIYIMRYCKRWWFIYTYNYHIFFL